MNLENQGTNEEFSLDDIYFKDAFTKTDDKLNLEVDNLKIACLTSKNNKFSLDEEGNLTVNSITSKISNQNTFDILSVYPIGSIYMSVSEVNPSTLFGGTWQRITGRFLLGAVDNNNTYGPGKTGGEEKHTLTISEMPRHSHLSVGNDPANNSGIDSTQSIASYAWSSNSDLPYGLRGSATFNSGLTSSTGGETAHNNMPPFLAVYIWKRIN